ncbi:uncharacterized protein LOC124928593 [Impatiens glandulifera]|uniref:uncharacterized protein LOC124928593 n=1 Tax=Impatiens glandulifera TaxID=253017 RepID=UPI001FB1426E|nr:uncharacterized protein LOC124928593 [Impatiens glandulifera]
MAEIAEVFVMFKGEWKITDGASSFVANSSKAEVVAQVESNSCKYMMVSQNTTYAELLDIIYDALVVYKSRYDLVLQVKYNVPGMQNPPTVVINQDKDVMYYLLRLISGRTPPPSPLFVSLLDKSPSQELIPLQQDVFES